MKTVLVLHALNGQSRLTNVDHVLSLPARSDDDLFVFHHVYAPTTPALRSMRFDACVMNYCFLAHKVMPHLETIIGNYQFVRENSSQLIAIPQDEYSSNAIFDEWLSRLGVDHVFSALENDLQALYPKTLKTATFSTVLTGYMSRERLAAVAGFAKPFEQRSWDVGTRVNFLKAYLGRRAQEKGQTAERFKILAEAAGFKQSISTSHADVLMGDQWLRFLGDCRFTVGSRGGASLPDPYGRRRVEVDDFVLRNPNATFEEIEAACFPGEDRYDFSAIGPRVIEAAATRTCQILIRGKYLDGMEPWVHYVPLEPDFSNTEEVFAFMREVERPKAMADACYDLVIASGRYTYDEYADEVLAKVGPSKLTPEDHRRNTELLREHFEELEPFERLRSKLNPAQWFGLRTLMFYALLFTGMEGLRLAARAASELDRDISVEEVMLAAYPPPPHSRRYHELAPRFLNAARRAGVLEDVIRLAELAQIRGWTTDAFQPWDFCDYSYGGGEGGGDGVAQAA